ncbi:hypothetical protein [Azonexus hydrophilus]|uniref:Uncharacterized protein n=1 Tax=Azonexus hydrophilus TaxID=418702 RepID=A0ABZ2XL00_9RHOO
MIKRLAKILVYDWRARPVTYKMPMLWVFAVLMQIAISCSAYLTQNALAGISGVLAAICCGFTIRLAYLLGKKEEDVEFLLETLEQIEANLKEEE